MKRICNTSSGIQYVIWFIAIATACGWFGR